MEQCEQAPNFSVLAHGFSVRDYFLDLYNYLKYDLPLQYIWKIPDWLLIYKNYLIQDLLNLDIINEYLIFHDCGKFLVKNSDLEGKNHFPNHAEKSSEIWLNCDGNAQAAICMRLDMKIHTMSAEEIPEFLKNPEAITLLLAGLAEIHSNAQTLFGGINSNSFKIKWKHLNRRGKALCQLKYGEIK